jgi:hypothetical protein
MTFDPKRFNQIARAADFAIWVLQTTDLAAPVAVSGYITPPKAYLGLLKPGHIVVRVTYATTAYATLTSWGIHAVAQADAVAINLTDELAGVVTNATVLAVVASAPRAPDESDAAYKARTDLEEAARLDLENKARIELEEKQRLENEKLVDPAMRRLGETDEAFARRQERERRAALAAKEAVPVASAPTPPPVHEESEHRRPSGRR